MASKSETVDAVVAEWISSSRSYKERNSLAASGISYKERKSAVPSGKSYKERNSVVPSGKSYKERNSIVATPRQTRIIETSTSISSSFSSNDITESTFEHPDGTHASRDIDISNLDPLTFAIGQVNKAVETQMPLIIDTLLGLASHQAGDLQRMRARDDVSLPSWVPDWRYDLPEDLNMLYSSTEHVKLLPNGRRIQAVIQTIGTVNSLDRRTGSMRLLTHRSLRAADDRYNKYTVMRTLPVEDSRERITSLRRYCPSITEGDLVCRPIFWSEQERSHMAVLTRLCIVNHNTVCRVVGQMPLRYFGDRLPLSGGIEVFLI